LADASPVAGLPRETQMTTLMRETEVQLGSVGSVSKNGGMAASIFRSLVGAGLLARNWMGRWETHGTWRAPCRCGRSRRALFSHRAVGGPRILRTGRGGHSAPIARISGTRLTIRVCQRLARVRASMARLTPECSSNQMAREYLERGCLPAARQQEARASDAGATARKMWRWAEQLRQAGRLFI
jgi:hypothetical protein